MTGKQITTTTNPAIPFYRTIRLGDVKTEDLANWWNSRDRELMAIRRGIKDPEKSREEKAELLKLLFLAVGGNYRMLLSFSVNRKAPDVAPTNIERWIREAVEGRAVELVTGDPLQRCMKLLQISLNSEWMKKTRKSAFDAALDAIGIMARDKSTGEIYYLLNLLHDPALSIKTRIAIGKCIIDGAVDAKRQDVITKIMKNKGVPEEIRRLAAEASVITEEITDQFPVRE